MLPGPGQQPPQGSAAPATFLPATGQPEPPVLVGDGLGAGEVAGGVVAGRVVATGCVVVGAGGVVGEVVAVVVVGPTVGVEDGLEVGDEEVGKGVDVDEGVGPHELVYVPSGAKSTMR